VTTPPLPHPVWTRVRNTRTGETGIVRATRLDQPAGLTRWWWLEVETPARRVWWLASLCEAE
jgi:hypothetical protein